MNIHESQLFWCENRGLHRFDLRPCCSWRVSTCWPKNLAWKPVDVGDLAPLWCYFWVSQAVDRFVHIPVSLQGSPAGTVWVWVHKFQLPRWLRWPAWEEMMVYTILSESGVYWCILYVIVIYFLYDTNALAFRSSYRCTNQAQAGEWPQFRADLFFFFSAAWAIRGHTHIKSSV